MHCSEQLFGSSSISYSTSISYSFLYNAKLKLKAYHTSPLVSISLLQNRRQNLLNVIVAILCWMTCMIQQRYHQLIPRLEQKWKSECGDYTLKMPYAVLYIFGYCWSRSMRNKNTWLRNVYFHRTVWRSFYCSVVLCVTLFIFEVN